MPTVPQSLVENLLYKEARLLDSGCHDEWLSLWAADAVYWIPFDPESDPNRHATILYITRQQLEDRVFRLTSGNAVAFSQDPQPRLSRIISNIEVESMNGSEQLAAHSVFNLTHLRRGKQSTFAGRTEHVLTTIDGDLRIASKKVVLVNRDEPIPNLSFFL